MKNLSLAVFALSLFSVSAMAAEPASSGFYVGGMAGYAELDDDGLTRDVANDFGIQSNLDDSDVGFAIFGGYKILKYLAVEARLSSLGSYSVSFCDFDFCLSDDIDVTAVSTHVVGIIPFGASGWELFGQLGLGLANVDFAGDDENETVGSAGIGVRYYATPNLGISLQVDAYAYEAEGFNGEDRDVSVATTQVGVHYLF